MKIKRIAVSTGGGDCPGLNAVIRAVVKTASWRYGWEVLGIEDGFDGLLMNGKIRELTPWNCRGILNQGGTILGTTNRGNPFQYKRIKNGKEVVEDVSGIVIKNIKKHKIDAIVSIGGDGSLKIANELFKKGVKIVGVPKTIDNDLSSTDRTFGFDTAVSTATECLDRIQTTAESHHRVMVVEVMGRYVGWIALHAGIAGGADVILIPEIPFDLKKAAKAIKDRQVKGAKSSIVVVAEGAKPKGGTVSVIKSSEKGRPERLGGIANKVGEELEKLTGNEVRVTVLGHIQRGGSPTAFDRVLSTRYGVKAVELIAEGKFGHTACLNGEKIGSVSFDKAVAVMKEIDPKGELIRSAESIGINFGR